MARTDNSEFCRQNPGKGGSNLFGKMLILLTKYYYGFDEMMLGLMSWIPLYMTGKVTSFYLPEASNRIYCHTDYVSDPAVLYGECIRGYHNEGKYCLTQSETDLAYYKKQRGRLSEAICPGKGK